jgi:hypothetical protein
VDGSSAEFSLQPVGLDFNNYTILTDPWETNLHFSISTSLSINNRAFKILSWACYMLSIHCTPIWQYSSITLPYTIHLWQNTCSQYAWISHHFHYIWTGFYQCSVIIYLIRKSRLLIQQEQKRWSLTYWEHQPMHSKFVMSMSGIFVRTSKANSLFPSPSFSWYGTR